MVGPCRSVVWFRRDFRIEDNPALAAAARAGCVLPVYIWCPEEEGQFFPGRVSRWWIKQSLIHLRRSLDSLGVSLVLIKAQDSLTALLQCIKSIGADQVLYNHLYDPVSLVRDHNINQKLVELGLHVHSFNGDLLYEPWEVYDDTGHAFTTFGSFWDKCKSMSKEPVVLLPPCTLVPATGAMRGCTIEELDLEFEFEKQSNALLSRAWSPGCGNVDKGLAEFISGRLIDYSENRRKVSITGTSLLSPYLHFGELSIRKLYQSVRAKQIQWAREEDLHAQESVRLFLKSIGLREYSRYICFNFPFTHEKSLLGNLRYFPWRPNETHFKIWRQGRTGYPLVDAGMRELWATGWIHNRLRVITASFCVKLLQLPWTWGMKYFWDTLLDADLESDILGWQYISGSLPDSPELNFIDSPEMQGFKYDSEGEYVRQWVPELARMPAEWIHHPWDAPASVLGAAGVELGVNYPQPIVDVDLARDILSDAVVEMYSKQAAAGDTNNNVFNEDVADNSNNFPENSNVPRVLVRRNLSPCSSSQDQKVPSFHMSSNSLLKDQHASHIHPDRANQLEGAVSTSVALRGHDDLRSTAESSSNKKKRDFGSLQNFAPTSLSSSQEGESSDRCSSFRTSGGSSLQQSSQDNKDAVDGNTTDEVEGDVGCQNAVSCFRRLTRTAAVDD